MGDHDKVEPMDVRRSGAFLGGIAVVFLLFFSAAASADTVGFTVSYGNLFAIDVESGAAELIGPTGSSFVPALTLAPDGSLYAIAWVEDEFQLVVLDQESGTATAIGPLGVDGFLLSGLASDLRGRLWLTSADALYSVDSDTGAATLKAPLDRRVISLAVRWKGMLAFTDDGEHGRWLERLDPESGELTPLWDLGELQVWIAGSSFDTSGTLWFLGAGGGTLQVNPRGFFKMPDLSTGEVVETFFEVYFYGVPESDMNCLAIPQWPVLLRSRR